MRFPQRTRGFAIVWDCPRHITSNSTFLQDGGLWPRRECSPPEEVIWQCPRGVALSVVLTAIARRLTAYYGLFITHSLTTLQLYHPLTLMAMVAKDTIETR